MSAGGDASGIGKDAESSASSAGVQRFETTSYSKEDCGKKFKIEYDYNKKDGDEPLVYNESGYLVFHVKREKGLDIKKRNAGKEIPEKVWSQFEIEKNVEQNKKGKFKVKLIKKDKKLDLDQYFNPPSRSSSSEGE